jgi:hypothetical protein
VNDSFPEIDFARPFNIARREKDATLLEGLNQLTRWHATQCLKYGNVIANVYGGREKAERLEDVPYLPVRLFKHSRLASVPEGSISKVLTSSGTTGQQVSRILLDASTAQLQVRALSSIVQDFIGKHRLPFVNIDQDPREASKSTHTARAAGVLGFSTFGHHHFHLLDDALQPRWVDFRAYLDEHAGQPLLLFGFTFVVWQHFVQAARQAGITLDCGPDSILIHGGGWKKLAALQINNDKLKAALTEQFGIRRISNYYGMVEQVGSIYMECDAGHLHTPSFADVLIRDPITLQPAEHGVIQVLSLLPRSYPGHSILTEDLGSLLGVDDCACGRRGRYFSVQGRIPAAEVRGCSDVAA